VRKTLIRYFVAALYSMAYGLLVIGLVKKAVSVSGAVIVGSWLAAVYTCFIGSGQFNTGAIVLGGMAGTLGCLGFMHGEWTPYGPCPYLLTAIVVTAGAGAAMAVPQRRPWMGRLVAVIHVLQTLLIIAGVFYSLFWPWARSLIAVITVTGFTIWSNWLIGGCPLTQFEHEMKVASGENTAMWQNGFIPSYCQRYLKIPLTHKAYNVALRVAAVMYFAWWILVVGGR